MTLLVATLVAPAIALVAIACSTSDRPAAGNGGTYSSGGAPPPPGTIPTSDASTEGGAPSGPALCQGLTLGQTIVSELAHSDPAPAAFGGTIAAGTYDLEGLDVYQAIDAGAAEGDSGSVPAVAPTGRSAAGVLVVTATSLQIGEAFGSSGTVGAPSARAYDYKASGTTLAATQVCPTTSAPTNVPYSATGGTIALFFDPKSRAVYRIRP